MAANTIPCWNCPPEAGNIMKPIAVDAFYWYYQCQVCGKESMVLREDRSKPGGEYAYLFDI